MPFSLFTAAILSSISTSAYICVVATEVCPSSLLTVAMSFVAARVSVAKLCLEQWKTIS